MKSAPSPLSADPAARPHRRPTRAARSRAGFTLVEILAALLMMAIVVPVAMEGMSVASRVGILGQRKAAAMRVAERVLNELIVENQTQGVSSSGTASEGSVDYPWSMRLENWTEDAMQLMTVTVQFTVRGQTHDISVATLLPSPDAATSGLASL